LKVWNLLCPDSLFYVTYRPEFLFTDVLSHPDCPYLDDAEFAQPLCTALQIGLVNLLRNWGIQPESVAGHSSGEIAAAYAAGAISMDVAIILSYYRGKVTKTQAGPGMMASVSLGKFDVDPYLEKGVVVACENSPRSATLSGIRDVLGRILDRISSDHPDVVCKFLPLNVAYHSGEIYHSYYDMFTQHTKMRPFSRTDYRSRKSIFATY
jgi:acyl transferase domain-containing protein